MALTVGTDSYITVAESDTYIAANYVSGSAEVTAWDALSDSDKEILLRRAAKRIDRQRVKGVKVYQSQALQFPRRYVQPFTLNTLYDSTIIRYEGEWVIETSVSQCVKDAQVEEALAAGILGDSATSSARQKAQQEGVQSVTLPDGLSETYNGNGASSRTVLLSLQAQDLLQGYISRGVEYA